MSRGHAIQSLTFTFQRLILRRGFVPQVFTIQNSIQHFLGYIPVLYNNIVFTIAK